MPSARTIIWYPAGVDPLNPDGSEVVLENPTGDGVFREVVGAAKFFAPSRRIISNETPGIDGARFESVTTVARDPEYRFRCAATDPVAFNEAMEYLVESLMGDGPGILEITNRQGEDAGSRRQLRCIYTGGLEGDPLLLHGRDVKSWAFTLKLTAFDPFWYSTVPVLARWVGKPGFALFPFDPTNFRLSPWGVTNPVPLEMSGTKPAWPSFTLSGPWSRVRFTRDRDGMWWEKSRDGDDPETILVNTKPGEVSVSNLAGDNRYGQAVGSQFFSLSRDDTVSVDVSGSTGATDLSLVVNPAWLSHL